MHIISEFVHFQSVLISPSSHLRLGVKFGADYFALKLDPFIIKQYIRERRWVGNVFF